MTINSKSIKMKFSLSLISICILSFILVYSCSTEEEDSVTPVSVAPVEYTLTVSAAEGGTVSTEGGTYEEGTNITITATANEGYRFIGWEGSESTNESLTINLNSDQTIQALFELIPIYTLTVTTNEGGIVSTEGGEYEEGTEVTITATANEGYRFDGWEGIDSNENTITLTVTSDTELTPLFNIANLSPTNYGVDEYWGKIVEFENDVFFTSDVPQEAIDGFHSTLNFVIDYFGNYGPTEWWIIGNEQSPIENLAIQFADRRQQRNQLSGGDYQRTLDRARNYFNSYKGITNAGLNGARHFGYHLLMISEGILKGGVNAPISQVMDQPNLSSDTVTHEYVHVVQAANLFNKNEEDRPDGERKRVGWGPIFFSEGSAVYYGEYVYRKLRSEGVNIVWNTGDLKSRMRNIMENDIQPNLGNCPNFNIWEVNYSTRDTCSPYTIGAWGVAYLLDKVNDQDAFWKTLWPNIDEMGWDGAFEFTFGITMEQFNQEFLEFLELPIEKQLEIIPDI